MEVAGDPHRLNLDRIMLNSLLTDLRGTELSLVVSLSGLCFLSQHTVMW